MAGLLASPVVWANVTGTYVAANGHHAFEIQVIETPHSRLVGHFVELAFGQPAQTTRTDASVSGCASGSLIVMALKKQAFCWRP